MNSERSTASEGRGKGRVYFGWWVSIAGFFNMVVSSGPTFQASSVLFKAVEDEFGWSRALISGVASFGRFGGAMLGPVEGFLTDRFGSGKMVLIGFLMGGAGLMAFSQIQGPLQYYFAFFLLSLGFSVGGFTPSMTAVNSWMVRRRTTAMSLVIGGSSVGGLLVPPIVWGISAYGWRPTVFVIGVVAIISGPFIAYFLGKRPTSEQLEQQIQTATHSGGGTRQSRPPRLHARRGAADAGVLVDLGNAYAGQPLHRGDLGASVPASARQQRSRLGRCGGGSGNPDHGSYVVRLPTDRRHHRRHDQQTDLGAIPNAPPSSCIGHTRIGGHVPVGGGVRGRLGNRIWSEDSDAACDARRVFRTATLRHDPGFVEFPDVYRHDACASGRGMDSRRAKYLRLDTLRFSRFLRRGRCDDSVCETSNVASLEATLSTAPRTTENGAELKRS